MARVKKKKLRNISTNRLVDDAQYQRINFRLHIHQAQDTEVLVKYNRIYKE